jgi:hypothetical protein
MPCHDRGQSSQLAEWLASPYSEPEGGRGCTDCHHRNCSGKELPRNLGDDITTVKPQRSIEAARLTVRATCTGEEVTAEVAVSNVGVGHLLPTGPPGRTLLLEVAAHDRHEAPLPIRNEAEHPTVNRAAVGLSERYPANGSLPGAAVTVQSRLLPFATGVSRYRFVAPESGPVRITARLVLLPATGVPSEIASSASVCEPCGDEP